MRMIASIALLMSLTLPVCAGIWTSIDTIAETQYYALTLQDFRIKHAMWKQLGLPDAPGNTPLQQRYLLIEALGPKGERGVKSIEQALNYSAVLMRRNKPQEAVHLLAPLAEEHEDNFLIQSQCAMAHFLAGGDELLERANEFERQAMKAWPEQYERVPDEQKKFLAHFGFDDPETFSRLRRYEVALQRLISSRLSEARKAKRKQAVPEGVDPIFGDAKNPVRLVNEKGEFEPGHIPDAEFKRLPNDALETVKQLLIWMPRDDRLMWLLGEVYNASALGFSKPDDRNNAMRDAYVIFKALVDESFTREIYGAKQLKIRVELLDAKIKDMPPPNIDGFREKKNLTIPDDKDGSTLTNEQWWRTLLVGVGTGAVIGVFALWQMQEWRRRRQART